MILIISHAGDEHATAVLAQLSAMGYESQLLDLAEFPLGYNLSLDYKDGAATAFFRCGQKAVSLVDCDVIWWRRPQPLRLPDELITSRARNFAYGECHEALAGLWLTLPAFWVNHPTRDDEASHKPYQLKVASAAGLQIPRTLMTSDPSAARAFVNEVGIQKTVYKAFTGTENAWRETRLLRASELAFLDDLRFAPVILQEYIPAVVDVRITVIGNSMFASAVDTSGGTYHADYRMELKNARIEPYELPANVQRLVREFVERLGLVYGAIDVRVTPEGKCVFLEINPGGQWLFMEERTGQRMTAKFAELLASHAGRAPGSPRMPPYRRDKTCRAADACSR